jgi:hypothetical protein
MVMWSCSRPGFRDNGLGFRFRVKGFRGLGFRVLGFKGIGFQG